MSMLGIVTVKQLDHKLLYIALDTQKEDNRKIMYFCLGVWAIGLTGDN